MKTTLQISLRQAATAIFLFSCFFMNSQSMVSAGKMERNNNFILPDEAHEGARTLSIDLLAFSAVNSNGQVNLTWATRSEKEGGFLIERSVEGLNWEVMTLDVEVTSSDAFYYNCVDSSPFTKEISYYRLKQIGSRGDYAYSDIVAVEMKKQVNLKLYPNPVVSYVQVVSDGKAADVTTVDIYNAAGQLVKKAAGDSNSLLIDVMDLEAGNYFAVVGSGAEVSKIRFVKN